MKENFTEIVCIIDRSGSMHAIRDDAIGGFNQFLEEQKGVPGEAQLTLVLFNHQYKLVHDGVGLTTIPPLDHNTYRPAGTTALLDAIGRTIDTVGERLAQTPEKERPTQVIVSILTDGLENSSRDYTQGRIAEMISHQESKYSWEFIFLGANMDAFKVASMLNISAANTSNFVASSEGTRASFRLNAEMVTKKRLSKQKK